VKTANFVGSHRLHSWDPRIQSSDFHFGWFFSISSGFGSVSRITGFTRSSGPKVTEGKHWKGVLADGKGCVQAPGMAGLAGLDPFSNAGKTSGMHLTCSLMLDFPSLETSPKP